MWEFVTSSVNGMERRFRHIALIDHSWHLTNDRGVDGRWYASAPVLATRLSKAYFGAYLLVQHKKDAWQTIRRGGGSQHY